MSQGPGAVSEIDTLKLRLRQWREAFAAACEAQDWTRIRELDTQMQRVLRQLIARPELKDAVRAELNALRDQHELALATCRRQLAALEQKMQAFQRDREGLRAYNQISENAGW